MKRTEYVMSKEYFNELAECLKEHDDVQAIINGYTKCLMDMILNDLAFLGVDNDCEQRRKVIQFQNDLLAATK